MYKRNVAYPNLGFDNFLDSTKLPEEKIDNSAYSSDESAFNRIFDALKSSNSPDFIHLVTMQNHMPYTENTYNSKNFPIKNISGGDDEAKYWETYLEGINKSDQALEKFIEKIQNFNEKTIVVFWGDHWPGIASAFLNKEDLKNSTQNTPLFIYSNFETEKKDIGTTSLNYLQTKILERANVKLSPFQYLLLDTAKENPALTKKIKTNQSQALKDYELIEYDILAGSKYSLGDFFKTP